MSQVSLSPRSRVLPAGDQTPRITEAGIFLGPSPLAVQRKSGRGAAAMYETTDTEELAETLAVAFGWSILSDFDARLRYLQSAVKSLGDGALTRAHISLAFMNLPKLTPGAVDRLRQLEVMRKYNTNVATESRDWRGQWTADGDGGSQVQIADNQTTVQSDAPDPSAGIRDPHIVTLRDGSVVTDYQGNPMKKPPDVSLDENAKLGEEIFRQYQANGPNIWV